MNKYYKRGIAIMVLFCVLTALVLTIDVQAIGPNGSSVGFAGLNGAIRDAIGQNEFFYKLTDYLGKTAILVCLAFAGIGLYQWIKRGKIMKVDQRILLLGLFYIVVISFYVFFNKVAVNFRPILEADGSLEASYPSSHTVLAVCVFRTMFWQDALNQNGTEKEKKWNGIWGVVLPAVMLVGRLLSGVHWFTDILGALLLSCGLCNLYHGVITTAEGKKE